MSWVLIAAIAAVLFWGEWKIFDFSKEHRTEATDKEEADQIASSLKKSPPEKTPWGLIIVYSVLLVAGLWTFDHYFLAVLHFFQDLLSGGQ